MADELERLERRRDELAELPAALAGSAWAAARDTYCRMRFAPGIERVGTSERSEA